MKSSTTSPAAASKFYLQKHRNKKYYVVISRYNSDTKKNNVSYRSLKTNNKQQALINFNTFVNAYLNNVTEVPINKNIELTEFYKDVLSYLETDLKKGTVKIYRIAVKNFVRIIGNKQLRLYTLNDIETYKSLRLNEVSKYTLNIDISTLKALFNLAIKLNYLNRNVFKETKKIKIEDKKIKVFTETEIELLLNNIHNQLLLRIVKFGLFSGLRLNEILNITTNNINLNDNVIEINNTDKFSTKNGKNKICILNHNLKNLLTEILKSGNNSNVYDIAASPDRYLFTVMNRNYPISKNYISGLFKRECRKLNFREDLHFHSLRHTYISNLINKGVPLNFVKEIIGHSNIATTMKYITLNKNELVKYANQV